jgi:hypothetical protein
MVQKILGAQRDFSYGEVDVALKRSDDHPARKAGLRQMANARILNSAAVQNRPGRSALFPITNSGTRTEEFTISSGNIFKICFGPASIQIINSVGAVVQAFTTQGNGAALPWASAADIQLIDYAIFNLTITICFGHSMRPQVITYDGVSTWSIADYIEAIRAGGQKRTPFYRISPQGITMVVSGTSGIVNIAFSNPVLVPGHVGTRFRYCGRQLTVKTVTSSTTGTATVNETLPPAQSLVISNTVGVFNIGDEIIGATTGALGVLTASASQQTIVFGFAVVPISNFQVGDTVTGGTSAATGIVTAVNVGLSPGNSFVFNIVVSLSTGTLFQSGEVITGPHGSGTNVSVSSGLVQVQLLQKDSGNVASFSASETIAGPSGTATISSIGALAPQAVEEWEDEVINTLQGFPGSCFVDQFRLGFCDFPTVPGGIGWSAINSPNDLYAEDASSPDNAIFEVAPDKVRVFYVVPGMESSEFVFTDRKLYYIQINATSPLKPGSVGFQILSSDGCAQVKPRPSQETILYANAGKNSVMAVTAPGNYYRPFETKALSEFHEHLFSNIVAIAAPTADGTFNERYAYVMNGNGSIVIGKYTVQSGQFAGAVGWGPWSGGGSVSWVAAWNADVLFTTSYFGVGLCEVLDDTQYLDGAVSVNNLPAAFTPPGGKGPLYLLYPGQSVTLMDQVTRAMGTYHVDANGFIVPQFNGGENLSIASLVAGQPWTMTVEPFCPDANPGTDMGQRMFKRRVSRFAANVVNSTGFLMARLFSGPITPTSPALGTIMNQHRVPTWNQGDDATKPPPLREITERMRPIGRSFDPRVAIIKDSPGPLLIAELGMEATI